MSLSRLTFAAGEATSDPVQLGENVRLDGIYVPTTWISAPLSFQISFDGGTEWATMRDWAGEALLLDLIGASSAEPSYYAFSGQSQISGSGHFRLYSGTPATPVPQPEEVEVLLAWSGD